MPNDPSYLAFVQETLAPLGEVSYRPMFGGHTFYCGGVAFALVAHNALYLKADANSEAQFLAAGLPAFHPFPDKPGTMRYHLAPPEFFESPEVMREWAEIALAAAVRKPPRKKKT